MTDLCASCIDLGIRACPAKPGDCDLVRPDAPAHTYRAVNLVHSAPVRSPFPARVPGWCTSDNIVLARGPRKLRP